MTVETPRKLRQKDDNRIPVRRPSTGSGAENRIDAMVVTPEIQPRAKQRAPLMQ
jgi:hypothetical protein